jgi:hypothetical protein
MDHINIMTLKIISRNFESLELAAISSLHPPSSQQTNGGKKTPAWVAVGRRSRARRRCARDTAWGPAGAWRATQDPRGSHAAVRRCAPWPTTPISPQIPLRSPAIIIAFFLLKKTLLG